ncbi:albusnodin/ikarugamycin family macrolactam cyclase [Streptomyces mayteni]
MRWVAGWEHPFESAPVRPYPSGVDVGRVEGRAWAIGAHRVAAVRDGAARLAVVGWCGASRRDLEAGLAAMRRGDWGRVTHWPGSYLTVFTAPGSTVVVNDLAGTWSVYWRAYGGGWIWATSARALAALGDRDIDTDFLSASLVVPLVEELNEGRSAWRGVRRLSPGHALVLGDRGARTEPYAVEAASRPDAEELREALVEAVDLRTSGVRQITADLSGGLDSTTVAVLAAARRPVFAVTYTHPALGNGDDLHHAGTAARGAPAIERHLVSGSDADLPYGSLNSVPPTDAPTSDLLTLARRRAYLMPAARRDSEVHLTGNGGDAVLSTSPAFLADLVASGRHLASVRETLARARLWRVSAQRLWRAVHRLGRQSYADGLWCAAGRLDDGDRGRGLFRSFDWVTISAVADWLLPEVRWHLAERLRSAAETVRGDEPPGGWRDWRGLRWFGAGHAQYLAVADRMGLRVSAPFLDNRVVRATLGSPSWERTAARQPKPQLRAAMGGLVPESVLARRTKASFSGHGYAGLRARHGELRELLATSRLAEWGPGSCCPLAAGECVLARVGACWCVSWAWHS